jgi:hypothetical protein
MTEWGGKAGIIKEKGHGWSCLASFNR